MKVALFLLALLSVAAAPAENGIRQQGQYMTAPITLDADRLFRIAAPAAPGAGQVRIAARQADIENALAQIIAVVNNGRTISTLYSPKSTRVLLTPSDGQVVLQVVDATHPAAVSILTVTPADAKYYGMTVTSLAKLWQPILETALRAALLKRQPAVEQRNRTNVAIAGGALVFVTLLFWLAVIMPLRRRIADMEDRAKNRGDKLQEAQHAPSADQAATHERRRHFLALAIRAGDPRRAAAALRSVVALIIWLLLLMWFGAFVWGFFLFPQTTPLGRQVLHTATTVAAIWIGAGVLNRILDLIVARIGQAWRVQRLGNSEERTREMLRIPTITAAISGFKAFMLFFVALLLTLGEIGIPVWSVVTFGGLTAIGLTLAAQNFVRDFVNGFLVLFEDQYVVGDYITINAQSGIVEELTLRMAQLRDTAGNLITIPHSSVTTVVNHSRNWSRVDYRISVDPATDADRAIALVREAVHDIVKQEPWKALVLEPVEWIGVDSLSRDGIVIRASMKTAPLRQFELRRAINERVAVRFKEAEIALGAPVPQDLTY